MRGVLEPHGGRPLLLSTGHRRVGRCQRLLGTFHSLVKTKHKHRGGHLQHRRFDVDGIRVLGNTITRTPARRTSP